MHVLIFGATSDIAQELAKQYAQRKADVTLLGIDTAMLAPFKADLEIRYSVKIKLVEFDILNYSAPDVSLISLIDSSDVSIMLIGYLGDQDKADENDNELLRIINLNYVKVSSVAGDRGKQSNFAYGSAKAGLSVYLDGLRNRLYPKGIHVLTIKPGFMATKMTEHMDLPKPLTASPKAAAKAIINAIDKKKNKIYINWIWKYLMMVIKTIPEPVFKKMKM
jgi:short-subunit dehydrogenase